MQGSLHKAKGFDWINSKFSKKEKKQEEFKMVKDKKEWSRWQKIMAIAKGKLVNEAYVLQP